MELTEVFKKNILGIALNIFLVFILLILVLFGNAVQNITKGLKNIKMGKPVQTLNLSYSQGVDNQIHPNPHTQKEEIDLWYARLNNRG